MCFGMYWLLLTIILAPIKIYGLNANSAHLLEAAVQKQNRSKEILGDICDSKEGVQANITFELDVCKELSIFNQNKLQEFFSLPKETRHQLKSISISSVNFKTDIFLKTLEECLNLEMLNLTAVSWNGTFSSKVHLPKLMSFSLVAAYGMKIGATELSSLIFFYQENRNWTEDKKLLTTVDITIGSLFQDSSLNRDVELKGSELSLWNVYDSVYLNLILTYRAITKLSLYSSSLTSKELKHFRSVKYVEIVWSPLIGAYVSELLGNCTEAEEIRIEKYQPESIDLESWKPSRFLRTLELNGISFRWSANDQPLHFPKLEVFSLRNADFVPSLVRFSGNLKSFKLQDVSTLHGNFEDLFLYGNFTELNQFELSGVVSGIGFQTKPIVLDIASIPNGTLKNLTVKKGDLISSKIFEFPVLNSLILFHVQLHGEVYRNFSYFFKNSKSISFADSIWYNKYNEYFTGNTEDPLLLFQALKTKARRLSFTFNWNSRNDTPGYVEALNLLTSLNVPKACENIDLEIAETATNFEYTSSYCRRKDPGWRYIIGYIILMLSICGFGLIGNLLSALVLSRAEMKKFSSSYILLALAFWDTVFLITSALGVFILLKFFVHYQYTGKLLMYLVYPLNKTAYTASVYLTLLLTVDRFIAVSMPLRAKSLLNTKRTLQHISVVCCFSIFLNFPRWIESIPWNYALEDRDWNFDNRPSLDVIFDNYRMVYNLFVWSPLMYAVPFLVIIGLNFKIWLGIRRANASRRGMAGQSDDGDNSVTKMLISIVILFLICNSLNALMINASFFLFNPEDGTKFLIEFITMQPLLINSAANFIIYCVMGKKFRSQCIKLFCQNNCGRNGLRRVGITQTEGITI